MSLVTPADLGVYLGVTISGADSDRAQMLIDDAVAQALVIVGGVVEADLPPAAAGIIRGAVARLYLNPEGVNQETVGPYTYARSAATGSIFSVAERASLERAASLAQGSGGAFSIDTLPADYAPVLPWWDRNGSFPWWH